MLGNRTPILQRRQVRRGIRAESLSFWLTFYPWLKNTPLVEILPKAKGRAGKSSGKVRMAESSFGRGACGAAAYCLEGVKRTR